MVLLVRFGEIALKSRFVRRQLLDRLVANIQDLFAAERVDCATEADRDRVYVDVNDVPSAMRLLRRVFGIVSFSPAEACSARMEDIRDAAVGYAKAHRGDAASFAVIPRRTGQHPYGSRDLSREVGQAVKDATRMAVNLSHPDFPLHVEVRRNHGFLFHESVPGPGGLPLGSQGRVLAIVEDDPGLVAAWMAMKRGCRVVVASSVPEDVAVPLRRWDVRLKTLSFERPADVSELLRLARAQALVVGWDLSRLAEADPKSTYDVDCAVYHPIVGLAREDVEASAEAIRAG